MDAFTGIRQAVVMAREDVPGLVRLVGYFTCTAAVDQVALKAHLAAMMPDYMVPSVFVMLDAFPLTPNRKVDRKALPAPQVRTVATAPAPMETAVAAPAPRAEEPPAMTPAPTPAASAAPSGDTFTQSTAEAAIAAIWSRILGVQGIGARDNFFDLGGHSLLAVQAHREIRADLGIRSLSITDIFRFPVLSALAAKLVDEPLPEGSTPVAAPAPTAPAPAAPQVAAPPPPAPQPATQLLHPSEDRATFRTEAMNRRRQLRAERLPRTG